MNRHRITALLTALVLIVLLAPRATASSNIGDVKTYDSEKKLFHDRLNLGEALEITKDYPESRFTAPYGEGEQTITTYYDYVVRTFKGDMDVTEDAVIASCVHIQVRRGSTLTVREGVTLTVIGKLEVEGTLDNRGTIVVDAFAIPGFVEIVEPDNDALITSSGTIRSSGALNIKYGKVENFGGTLTNGATITITGLSENLIGIYTDTAAAGGKTNTGTFTNSGTIHVRNTAGTGIKTGEDALFQNDGVVYKSSSGTIAGAVSGTAVQSAS